MEKHERNKRLIKIFGFILLGVGAVFTIIGFVSFFQSFFYSDFPENFWCAIVGLPCMGGGGMLLSVGFRREIARYMEKEHAPVVNEAAKDMTPAVKTVVSAVKEGLSDDDKRICACGTVNDSESIFCKACGKRLVGTCASCGATVPSDAEYCPKCGKKL